MKTAKKILCVLVLCCFTMIFSGNIIGTEHVPDYPGGMLPEVVVTCSSGTFGKCFYMDWKFCEGYKIDMLYFCKYTGQTHDNCGEFWVKFANWIMDRCTL